MKKIVLLLLYSFFSLANSGQVLDELPNLEGQYFGHVKYDGIKRQVGLLLSKDEKQTDSYYGVAMEYLSPFREKNFINDFLRPGKKKLFRKKHNGYLQELLQWIKIYKFERIPGTQIMRVKNLKVVDGSILEDNYDKKTILFLGSNKRKPLKKATLITEVDGLPLKLELKRQRRFPLKSTWEKEYTPGPYNPGYKQGEIEVLSLIADFDKEDKTATAIFNVDELKGEKIEIKGEYQIKEAKRGMFTFVDTRSRASVGSELVQDKIGVFIDVYNAQPIMNTFELILIDPVDPKNSQMYFEEYGNK